MEGIWFQSLAAISSWVFPRSTLPKSGSDLPAVSLEGVTPDTPFTDKEAVSFSLDLREEAEQRLMSLSKTRIRIIPVVKNFFFYALKKRCSFIIF